MSEIDCLPWWQVAVGQQESRTCLSSARVVTYVFDVALSVSGVSRVQTVLCGVGIGCGKIALYRDLLSPL
jgi:hypothetical protein